MASDKMISGIGALLIILGILVILTPWILFPVCEVEGMYLKTASGMQQPMKCGVDYDFPPVEGLVMRKVVKGTRNFRRGPAMTREEAEKCIDVGIEMAAAYANKGYALFGTGDMGIGNTTPSAAIAAIMTGKPVSAVTGRGTGIDDDAMRLKIRVIEETISLNRPDPKDPVDILAKLGGAEIGGIAGLILGCSCPQDTRGH